MKMNKIKRIVLLLVAVLMCLSLCSCKELNERRDHHVLMQEDDTLLWKGQVYRPLPWPDEMREFMVENDYDSMLYVTKSDVPVLLNRVFYECGAYSLGDGLLIRVHGGSWEYYCRSDRYDELVSVIKEDAPMTKYYYMYYMEEWKNYFLTEEQMDIIRAVLADGETVSAELVKSQYATTIFACDEKEWFQQFFLNIEYSEEEYYLQLSKGYYEEFIRVPEEYNSVFAQIVAMDREWNHKYVYPAIKE